jgi:hypothetical protein
MPNMVCRTARLGDASRVDMRVFESGACLPHADRPIARGAFAPTVAKPIVTRDLALDQPSMTTVVITTRAIDIAPTPGITGANNLARHLRTVS